MTIPSSFFEKNVQQIVHFPEDPKAQIKVIGDQLTRADESTYYSKIYNWKYATTLSQTVAFISEKVLQPSDEKFKQDLEACKNQGASNRAKISTLQDDVVRDIKLLKGLERIHSVYLARYQATDPHHDGLEELKRIEQAQEQKVREEVNQYLSFIESVNQPDLLHPTVAQLKSQGVVTNSGYREPTKNLEAYLYTYATDIAPQAAKEWIKEGKELLNNIRSGQLDKVDTDPVKADHQMTVLMWHLMDLALTKAQGFEQGTFILEDPNDRVYKFLQSHPKAYNRISSHYAGRSESMHRGIDVFNGKLLAHKRTLLFEQVKQYNSDQKVLFLKPENFGANPESKYDLFWHAEEYIISQYTKFLSPESDVLPNIRRERVPPEALKAFANIVKVFNEKKSLFIGHETLPILSAKEDPIAQANLYGISYMHQFVEAIKSLSVPKDFDPTPFEKSIEGLDFPERRTGREVYIPVEPEGSRSSINPP